MNVVKTSGTKINIAISWSGIPAYGARLIREGIKRLGHPVIVIGTMPQMSTKDSEELLGQKIYWIDKSNVNSWHDIDLSIPDIFFQAGWFIPSFNKLGREVRDNGGKVICLIDNCWKNNIRQWMGAVKFRFFYKKWFSAVWVPGESAVHLMRFFGMPSSQIYTGLYGSDSNCFTPGPILTQRPKQFIFIGQFIARKGVSTLAKAFKIFHQDFPDWKILVYGAGEYKNLLESCPGVIVHPFMQSLQIADALKRSRFLVLPSIEDHWPLVVSEAALTGCGLILSDRVGNRYEFLNKKNGFIFKAKSVNELSEKLKEAASLPGWKLNEVYNESKRLSSFYVHTHWAEKFHQIISEIRSS
ncbi:MAG: glycosyltransferase family 4 protein [bacterium]